MNFTKKDYKKRYNIEAYSLAPTAFDKLPNSSIGLYWGEGHGSSRIINKKKIVKCAFEMIPDGMTLTMRHPKYISLAPAEYEKQASLHDDFLVGKEHPWGMIPFEHPEWKPLLNKCKHSFRTEKCPGAVIQPCLL